MHLFICCCVQVESPYLAPTVRSVPVVSLLMGSGEHSRRLPQKTKWIIKKNR